MLPEFQYSALEDKSRLTSEIIPSRLFIASQVYTYYLTWES